MVLISKLNRKRLGVYHLLLWPVYQTKIVAYRFKFSEKYRQTNNFNWKLVLIQSLKIQGYLCHPYLSLSYMEILNDPNIRGYVIGATNVLFKQKKSLFDVVIEVLFNDFTHLKLKLTVLLRSDDELITNRSVK